jgi:DNA repair photolyase
MLVKELVTKTAIHFHNSKYGDGFDVNIYRGCEHCCEYCFAKYTHEYLSDKDFYKNIYVKINIAEILDKELSKRTWNNKNIICISAVTDCYQPLEERYKLMQQILPILIKHRQSVFIITKSPLIIRDYELFRELSNVAFVRIAFTITSLDEEIRHKIEPNVKPALERLKILGEFAKIKNIKTAIFLIPIIPYLTDKITNLEQIYKASNDFGIDYIATDALNMRGKVKDNFYDFLKNNFTNTYEKIQGLYLNNGYVNEKYLKKLYGVLEKFEEKYEIKGFDKMQEDELKYKNKDELFS